MIRKYAEIFCWKNVSSFCSAKATHIFSLNNRALVFASLDGSVGCASYLFFMEIDHEIFSKVILSFPSTEQCWFKKGSCQFLVKEWTQVLYNCFKKTKLSKEKFNKVNCLAVHDLKSVDLAVKLQTNQVLMFFLFLHKNIIWVLVRRCF